MWEWIKNRRRKGIILIGYALFGLLMFLFFFYWTFPFSLLESKWIQTLEKESGCKIDVREKRIYFPLRTVWSGVLVACPEAAFPTWNIESIDASLAPLPLFLSRRGEVDFKIKAAGGEATGRLTAVRKPEGISFSLKNVGKRFHLAQPDGKWSALLDVEGEGSWTDRNILAGKGRLAVSLEGIRVREIGPWTLPIGELSFSKAAGKAQWNNGMITFEQWTAQGPKADLIGGGGTFLLQAPIDRSLLNLTFQIAPKEELKQIGALFIQGANRGTSETRWSLGVKGTLGQPQLSLNGHPLTP